MLRCLRAVNKGEIKCTQYRHGAITEGWPPRWPRCSSANVPRGTIKSQSKRSLIRAAWNITNAEADFDVFSTLTFRVKHRDPKECLRRFLRLALGLDGLTSRYAWVQEYQERGIVHYHVLWCWTDSYFGKQGLIPEWRRLHRRGQDVFVLGGTQERSLVGAWVQATGDTSDAFWKFQTGGVHERVERPELAGKYLGSYAGKEAQKELPDGEAPAGRWWFLSPAAHPVPRGTTVVTQWKAKKPHRLVYDVTATLSSICADQGTGVCQ